MGNDEEGTLARLKAVRKALVDPTIAGHRGRIVKTTGDGMLVEFASAVDAVRCAVEVQGGMAEQNTPVPQGQRIEFRIGIHVGDIIIDDNDIFGDGVNVAARVENACEPGGVCVSGNAFEQIRGKTNFAFDDLGEKKLKNIERPVRLYAVRSATSAATTTTATISTTPSDNSKFLPLPDKPSIAVLPFQNMSGDPEQEYFADGMVEDIITALSRFKALFVIARNSSFTYKGNAVDIKQAGRELGVRYVLEGSVRKAGGKLRITGQLIEAATGAHLWADRFDGPLDDIFELQDKVTSSVVGAIAPRLEKAEMDRSQRKPTESLDAIDLYYRAIQSFRRSTRQGTEDALRLAREVISLDPNFSAAYGLTLECLVKQTVSGWKTIEEAAAEGKQYALRALEVGADDAYALARAAFFFGNSLKDGGTANVIAEQAIAVNPNLSEAWRTRGWMSSYVGQHEPAIEQFNYAMRLNPLDPHTFQVECGLAFANFFLRRFEIALSWATKSLARQNSYGPGLRAAMACYAMLDRIADAQMMLARLRETGDDLTISRFKVRMPYQRREDYDLLIEAFRLAGVPE
ncbi:MAG: adenylate/guanylate cyclase domain-containing protein [Bradyrhizobium sp.]|nr:MAG: adenylate/guanylate cyclase domain-containing protein [Bradyrhizobium sp.]